MLPVRARRLRAGILTPPIGIDQSNYFVAKGVSAFWVLGHGFPRDVTGNHNSATPTGKVGFNFSARGVTQSGNGSVSSNYWQINGPTNGAIIGGKANWTVIAAIQTTGSTASPCIYSERATSGNDILTLGLGNSNGRLICTYRNDAGTIIAPTTGKVVNDGGFHIIGASKNPTNIIQYADGKADITTAWGTNDNFTDNNIVNIGNTQQGLTLESWPGLAQFVALFPWTLDAADHAAFAVDPYQFLIFADDLVRAQLRGVPAIVTGGASQSAVSMM